MAIKTIENRKISTHNWNEFENDVTWLSVAVLKLELVYQYIGNQGFTCEADSLLGEAIEAVKDQKNGIKLFFECSSDGIDYNLEY